MVLVNGDSPNVESCVVSEITDSLNFAACVVPVISNLAEVCDVPVLAAGFDPLLIIDSDDVA